MNSGCTSAITVFAPRTSKFENQTPGPKLQKPCASGGEIGTRKKSGSALKCGGTTPACHTLIGRYSTSPAWMAARLNGVAKLSCNSKARFRSGVVQQNSEAA